MPQVHRRIDSVSRRPRERNEVINEAGVARIKIRSRWNFEGWRLDGPLAIAVEEAGNRGWKLDQRRRGCCTSRWKESGEAREKGADDEPGTERGYGCPLPRFLSSRYTTKNVGGKDCELISNDPGFLGGE